MTVIRGRNWESRTVFALPLLALTACNPSGYLPGAQVVNVDGRDYVVRRSGDSYIATMSAGLFGGKAPEAEVYVGNLRAIRDATGCPVATRGVVHERGQTVAGVRCAAGVEARL